MKAIVIGNQAQKAIQETESGLVMGVSSAGVYIKTPGGKIIFLTREPYKGPLTINLKANSGTFDQIEPSMEVDFRSEEISFPCTELRFQTSDAEIWSSPFPKAPLRSSKDRFGVFDAMSAKALSLIDEKVYSKEAQWLRAKEDGNQFSDDESLIGSMKQLHNLLQIGDYANATIEIDTLLGRGQGLTPAGDDLLIGWLLALNRRKNDLLPKIDLPSLNEQMIAAAYKKTTRISANLIECAVNGEGEERLIHPIDAIIYEVSNHTNIVEDMLSWGNSSGLFAFLGMGIALRDA